MKKYLLMCLMLFMLFLVNNRVYAEDLSSRNEWTFNGTVTSKYEFMIGDVVTVEDLEINGVLTNGKEEIGLTELEVILSYNSLDKIDNNKALNVILYSKDDYRKRCTVEINIIVNEFNSTLSHPLEGQEIRINKIHWKSEDGFDTISYYDTLDDSVVNYYGRPVKGVMKYSGNYYVPKLGYNTIKYRFTPYDKRFNQIYGTFIVLYKTKPYMVIGKDYINVHVQTSSYNLYLNGKKQTDNFISNLKSNTKYKIVIKQKNTPIGKDVTIWSGTVKTKK